MSAYEDAIGRAKRLLGENNFHETGTNYAEYKRGLIEMCAMFDSEREMGEAIQRAKARIEYNPERTVTLTIRVPDIDDDDQTVADLIVETLRHLTTLTITEIEVES